MIRRLAICLVLALLSACETYTDARSPCAAQSAGGADPDPRAAARTPIALSTKSRCTWVRL
ncbi:MAG: hypothetical protein AAGA32_20320 [Pseudomonadota bacterium]